jgi:hypothetical protein
VGSLRILIVGLLWAASAQAQLSVYSARPDAVSITIYREGIALVTETRRVELPAESVTLVFQGVVESLLPRSAVMDGADRALVATDFRFDRLTPAALLERSVGEVVTVVQTSRSTGTVTRLEAMIVSTERGVVLHSVTGNEAIYCSGLPQRLEFSQVPGELKSTPTLSVQLAGGNAGVRTITVSYLAQGFSWSADYVAHLNRNSTRMGLAGWITLRNDTGSSFKQAQVQVVAGQLNLQQSDEGGSRPKAGFDGLGDTGKAVGGQLALLRGCYPLGKTTDGLPQVPVYPRDAGYANQADVVDLNIIPANLLQRMDVVTGGASATYGSGAMAGVVNLVLRQELGDYQLYRLPWPTDLNARQTKQVAFLNKTGVKVERYYSIRVPWLDSRESSPRDAPYLMLRWRNERKTGLGEPLPAGLVRVFEPQSGGTVFTGEASIPDRPVNLPVEIGIARAMDLAAEFTLEDVRQEEPGGRHIMAIKAMHRFVNHKDASVRIEVRRADTPNYAAPDLVQSTLRARREKGGLVWRFDLPAGREKTLRYDLEAEQNYN